MIRLSILLVALGSLACTDVPNEGTPVPTPSGTAVSDTTGKGDADVTWEFPEEDLGHEGQRRNAVRVDNDRDARFVARGSVQFNRMSGSTVAPVNIAESASTCTDCQTIAVAVQVTLYGQGASTVAPENYAAAVNLSCTRCITVARGVQYAIPVADPNHPPEDLKEMLKELEREFKYFEQVKSVDQLSLPDVEARLERIIGKFDRLHAFLSDLRDEKREEGAGQTPTPAPSVTGTVAVTPSVSATPDTPTPSPEAAPLASGTPLPGTPTVTPVATGSPAVDQTATDSPVVSTTATPFPS